MHQERPSRPHLSRIRPRCARRSSHPTSPHVTLSHIADCVSQIVCAAQIAPAVRRGPVCVTFVDKGPEKRTYACIEKNAQESRFLTCPRFDSVLMLQQYHRCNADMEDDQIDSDVCPNPKKSKTEIILPEAQWHRLPVTIVDNIFQYLSFRDVVSASTTCHNWRQGLYHPRSWQRVTFVIEPDTLQKAQFLRTRVGHIVAEATIKFNSMLAACVSEFLVLMEYLVCNNNLHSLVLEPSHCYVTTSERMFQVHNLSSMVQSLLDIVGDGRPMTRITFGNNEELQDCLKPMLETLAANKPEKVKLLALASLKEDPTHYTIHYCAPKRFKPFVNLEILSIDFDILSDKLLHCLQDARNLHRLVVQVHGILEEHPGTSEDAWAAFKTNHPECLLRLSLIHAYDEVTFLDDFILKENMPLSHLRVLFCEMMNVEALESLVKYRETLRSITWIDSQKNKSTNTHCFLKNFYDDDRIFDEAAPHNLILVSWLCKKLEEIIILGYKYYVDDWIGIVKLRNDTLKNVQIAWSDIVSSDSCDGLIHIRQKILPVLDKRWTPLENYDLHPVLQDPLVGESDEYLMPMLLADLQ